MVREFADCPMTCMADGRKMLNLQYVEGALCEFRKFVTEQPQLAVLCGKIRARSGLKYLPKCGTAGGSEAASDYARWLSIVRCCVVNTWNTPDRTDRKIWAAADFGCSDRRSASASVGAVCSSVPQGIKQLQVPRMPVRMWADFIPRCRHVPRQSWERYTTFLTW